MLYLRYEIIGLFSWQSGMGLKVTMQWMEISNSRRQFFQDLHYRTLVHICKSGLGSLVKLGHIGRVIYIFFVRKWPPPVLDNGEVSLAVKDKPTLHQMLLNEF